MIRRTIRRKINTPKQCFYCVSKIEPDYKDSSSLTRFTSDRGKIVGKIRSGLCSKHQRFLTTAIKRARFIGLLPYINRAE